MSQVIFRNRSGAELSLLIGDGYILGPYEEVVLDQSEATVARQRYAGVLEEIQMESIGSRLDVAQDAPIWLANMAGNPDAPEMIDVQPQRNPLTGQMEMHRVPNNLRKPLDFSVRWRETSEIIKIGSASHERKLGKSKKTIHVWERKPVARKLAVAMLRRAANMGPGARGHLIVSRPPSGFEPDAEWSLDDIRGWLAQVDHRLEPILAQEPSEATIRRQNTAAAASKIIQREKIKNLKRVHIRAADPAYTLPTRSEFEAYMGRAEVKKALGDAPDQDLVEQSLVSEQVDPPKRGNGRPKKGQKEA